MSIRTDSRSLYYEIEHLRRQMEALYLTEDSLCSKKIIKISNKLDQRINDYMHINSTNKP